MVSCAACGVKEQVPALDPWAEGEAGMRSRDAGISPGAELHLHPHPSYLGCLPSFMLPSLLSKHCPPVLPEEGIGELPASKALRMSGCEWEPFLVTEESLSSWWEGASGVEPRPMGGGRRCHLPYRGEPSQAPLRGRLLILK